MDKKKIVIISSSETIRNFFYLEAISLGLSADSYEKFEKNLNDLSDYDLLIIDKDSIKQRPLNSAKKELTISTSDTNADIIYPISINSLRNIYISILKSNNDNKPSKEEITTDTITFLHEEKNVILFRQKKYLLSDTEIKLLDFLCQNRNRIISKQEIDTLLNAEESNLSNVYICKLRKKLESSFNKQFIFTVHSKGYKITVDAEWK